MLIKCVNNFVLGSKKKRVFQIQGIYIALISLDIYIVYFKGNLYLILFTQTVFFFLTKKYLSLVKIVFRFERDIDNKSKNSVSKKKKRRVMHEAPHVCGEFCTI